MTRTRAPTARRRAEPGWDPLLLAVAVATLSFVWRVHDLFPALRAFELPTLSILAALGAALFGPRRPPRRSALRHPLSRLMVALLALMALSVPLSLYQGLSLRFIYQDHLKTLVLVALTVYAIRSPKDVERLAMVQLLGAFLYSFVIFTRFEVHSGGRLGRLLFYDANDIALLIVSCLPFAVYLMRRGTSTTAKTFAVLVVTFSLLTLTKSGSRGGFLGLVAVGAYLALAYRAIPARSRLLATVGLVAAFSVVASDNYWDLMRTMLSPKEDYNWDSETGRRKVWRRGIGYMMDRPVLGVGVAAFPVAEGHLSDRAELQRFGIGWKWSAAHNSFLQIGAELGFPGLLAFVAMLGIAIRVSYRLGAAGPRGPPSGRDAGRVGALGQALTGALVGYCVVGFFLSHAYSAFLYSILGMVVGLTSLPDPRAAHSVRAPPLRKRSTRPRARPVAVRERHPGHAGRSIAAGERTVETRQRAGEVGA